MKNHQIEVMFELVSSKIFHLVAGWSETCSSTSFSIALAWWRPPKCTEGRTFCACRLQVAIGRRSSRREPHSEIMLSAKVESWGAVPSDFKGLAFKNPPFPLLVDISYSNFKRSWKYKGCLLYHFPNRPPLISIWRMNLSYVGFHEQIETVVWSKSICKYFIILQTFYLN